MGFYIKKRAFIISDFLVKSLLILIVVGAVLILMGAKFGYYIDITNLIPTGEKEPTEILGIDLIDNLNLKYYTGSSWKLIEDEKYMINNKEIVREDFRDELEKFYLATPRKGKDYVIFEEGFRKLQIVEHYGGGLIRFFPKGKYEIGREVIGKGTPGENERVIYLDFEQAGVYIRVKEEFGIIREEGKEFFIDTFGNIYERESNGDIERVSFQSRYSDAVTELIKWIDQILEGKDFVLFVTLEINETGEYESRKYTVRKVDQYVFVDLNKLASGEEKYFTEKVEGDGDDIFEGIEVSLDFALQEAERRTGGYSDNKRFVDWLYEHGFISDEEYVEINGGEGLSGLFNREGDMDFVADVLRQRKVKLENRKNEVEQGRRASGEIVQEFGLIPVIRGEEEFIDYYNKVGDSGKYYVLEHGHVYYTGTNEAGNSPRILLNDGSGNWWSLFGTTLGYTDFEKGEFVIRPASFSGFLEFDALGNLIWHREGEDSVYIIDPYETLSDDENQVKFKTSFEYAEFEEFEEESESVLRFELGSLISIPLQIVGPGGYDTTISVQKIFCESLFTELYLASSNNALIYVDEDKDGELLTPTNIVLESGFQNILTQIRSSSAIIDVGGQNIPVQEFIIRLTGTSSSDLEAGVLICG